MVVIHNDNITARVTVGVERCYVKAMSARPTICCSMANSRNEGRRPATGSKHRVQRETQRRAFIVLHVCYQSREVRAAVQEHNYGGEAGS